MADKDIGGIKFTVDGDDSGLKRVDESMEGLQKTAKDTQQGLDKTSKSTEKLGTKSKATAKDIDQLKTEVKENGDQLKTAAGYATAFTAALGTVTAIAAKAGKELNNMARLSGTSVEEFQKLAFGSNEVGVSTEKLGDIFKDARDKMGDFTLNAGGELKDFFDNVAPSVGYTAEQFKYMSGPEILQNLSNAMQAANIAGNEQINILESLANDAALLSPLLADNGKGFSDAAKRMEELNLVLSQTEVDGLVEVDKAFNELGTTVAKNTQRIVGENAEEIADAIKSVSEAIASATDFISENMDMIVKITTILGSGAAAWYAYRTAILVATAAQTAFNVAARANPVGLLVTALGLAAGAMLTLSDDTQTAKRSIDELTDSTNKLSRAEHQRLADDLREQAVQKQLELNDALDEEARIREKNKKDKNLPNTGADALNLAAASSNVKSLQDEYDELITKVAKAEKAVGNLTIEINKGAGQSSTSISTASKDLQKLIDKFTPLQAEERELLASQAELNKALKDAGEEKVPNITRALLEVGKQLDVVRGKMNELPLTQVNGEFQSLVDALPNDIPEAQFDGFINVVDDLSNSMERLSAIEVFDNWTNGIESVLQSFKTLTDEVGSGGAEMEVAIKAVQTAQAISAVLNQAQGEPYSAPARMALMAAAVASIAGVAVSVGGLGGSLEGNFEQRQKEQGAGSVLGMSDEKSDSIREAMEATAEATEKLVGIQTDMLAKFETLSSGMSGVASMIARTDGFSEFSGAPKMQDFLSQISDDTFGLVGGLENTLLDFANSFGGLGDVFTTALSGLIGGKSSISDEGLRIIGGSADSFIESVNAQFYQEVKSKKYAWSSTKTNTAFQDVSSGLESQIDGLIDATVGSVESALTAIGFSDVSDKMSDIIIDSFTISLKDLDAEEQLEEVAAVFSSILDNVAEDAAPSLLKFQNVAEGYGETLARLATEAQVSAELTRQLQMTGLSGTIEQQVESANALANAFGGAGKLAEAFTGFIDDFASDSQQFAIVQDEITRAFSNNNLEMQGSREELYAYAQALDLNTESGRNAFATLTKLSGSLDDYYGSLEQQEELINQFRDSQLALSREYMTEAQRTASITSELTSAFAEYGREVPQTREEFLALTQSIDVTTESGREALDALNGVSDSFDSMIDSTEKYIENQKELSRQYMSDAQRNALITTELTEAFAKYGLEVPKTREEFLALSQSIDTTTEAGRDAFDALSGVSGSFDALISSSEKLESNIDSLQQEYNSLIGRDDLNALINYEEQLADARSEDERQLINSIRYQTLLNEAREVEVDTLSDYVGLLGKAARSELNDLKEVNDSIISDSQANLDGMRDSINDQIEAEQKRANNELDRLQKEQSAYSDTISNARSLINMLDSAMNTLGERSKDLQETLFRQSFTEVSAAIEKARNTGELPNAQLIQGAVSQLSTAGSGEYTSRVDMERDALQARKLLSDLNNLSSDTLTDAEKQTKLLELQLKQTKESNDDSIESLKLRLSDAQTQHDELVDRLQVQYESQEKYYDDSIGILQKQLDSLNGINNAFGSFSQVLNESLKQSGNATDAVVNAGASSGVTNEEIAAYLKQFTADNFISDTEAQAIYNKSLEYGVSSSLVGDIINSQLVGKSINAKDWLERNNLADINSNRGVSMDNVVSAVNEMGRNLNNIMSSVSDSSSETARILRGSESNGIGGLNVVISQ